MNEVEINITNHAYDRAKERLGWGKSTLDGMVGRVYHLGFRYSDTKGKLKKHIDKIRLKHGKCNIRIYGENIYIFRGSLLITIYRLNNKLIKYIGI